MIEGKVIQKNLDCLLFNRSELDRMRLITRSLRDEVRDEEVFRGLERVFVTLEKVVARAQSETTKIIEMVRKDMTADEKEQIDMLLKCLMGYAKTRASQFREIKKKAHLSIQEMAKVGYKYRQREGLK